MLNIWRYIPAKIQAIKARFSNPIFDFYNSTLFNHYSTFIFQKSIFNFSRLRIDFVQLCERRAVIRKTRGAGERERGRWSLYALCLVGFNRAPFSRSSPSYFRLIYFISLTSLPPRAWNGWSLSFFTLFS